MKKRIFRSVVLIIPAVLILSGMKNDHQSFVAPKDNEVAARVNNEAITVGEIRSVLQEPFIQTYSELKKNHPELDSHSFWTVKYKEGVPADIARSRALRVVVRQKIQLMQAKDRGLVTDISYSGMLALYAKTNEERQKEVERHAIVYGPVKLPLDYFMQSHLDGVDNELKSQLVEEKVLSVSDEELRQYYDVHREADYKKEDRVKTNEISISFVTDGKIDVEKKQQAKELLEQMREKLLNGESIAKVARVFMQKEARPEIRYQQAHWYGTSRNFDVDVYKKEQIAVRLNKGEVSRIIELRGAYAIMQCVEKLESQYVPFSEVRKSLEKTVLDQKYQAWVDLQIKHARIEVVDKVYNDITV